MCQWWLLSSALIACCSVFSVTSFNVDSFNYASYTGPDSSMFGFSVAVHKETNNGWLIVGAPEAQSAFQQRVTRGGAVFKCPTNSDGGCHEIPFDTTDVNIDTKTGQAMDNKTEQWFGATVSASGSDRGPVVACAPRYTWHPKKGRIDPVGTCYVSDGVFSKFEEYSPCRTFQWGYHRQGSCQAGFSAAINSVGDRLFIGSPGSWYWQGQMYSVDAHAHFEFKPLQFSASYGATGQVHQQSLETRPAVFSTLEGSEQDDDSYMGYSTIVGDFQGNGEEGIAVGMPRGNNLKGKVLLFTWNLTNFLYHFTSDQLGSYYGYALAGSDVDGDGKLDLIIGAPMYTISNNEDKYDVGRVYVIYQQSKKGKYLETYEIDGFKSKSRFGQALASLGDINQDGYGDFAVGAPYDGPNERGAVYIYHGSNKGIRKKYSQVILAEDVAANVYSPLRTFGFAITGGLDLDGNEYPDMAVGAYLSSNAFFFRSRPVVIVEAYVKFLTPNKEVDIKKSNYNLVKGGKATRTSIDFCIKYHGKGIPNYVDLGLQYILDSKKQANPRMGFIENENTNILNDTIRLYKNKPEICRLKDVYVLSDIRDKLTSLVAEVKYWMQEESQYSTLSIPRNPRSVLRPILDHNSPPSRKDSISVHKDCGDDNICIPNLVLTVTPNSDRFLLGSKDSMFLDVLVANTGEDSFETTLEVKYPENVYFVRTIEEKVESHILCNTYENNTLKCEIGNPIPKDKVVNFKIFWQPEYKVGMHSTYDFSLLANSTNKEQDYTMGDNQRNISIGIWSNSKLEISGKSHPSEVFFNSSLYTVDITQQSASTQASDRLEENTIGPQVIHVYYLRNQGPATIAETEIFFVWPAATLGDEDLLYLLEPPHFSPRHNVQCGPIPANYRGFHVDISEKSIWERLNLDIESENEYEVQAGVGGGYVKNEQTLNKVVETGDSTRVQQERHNITQQKVTSSGTSGPGYSSSSTTKITKVTQNGVTRVVYSNETHYRNDSGVYVTSTGQMDTGGRIWQQGGQQGHINQGHSNTKIEYTSSGRPTSDAGSTLISTNKDTVTSGTSGGYHQQHQNAGNTTFVYKCLQRINGVEEEVPCGPNFSLPAINASLTQGATNIQTQYQCFEQRNGQWVPTQCEGDTPTMGTLTGGAGSTSTVNVNLVHKCKEERDGVWTEVECGPDGTYPDLNSQNYRSRFGGQVQESGRDVNIVHECYQTDSRGYQRKVECKPDATWSNRQGPQIVHAGSTGSTYQESSEQESRRHEQQGSVYHQGSTDSSNYDQESRRRQQQGGAVYQQGSTDTAGYDQESRRHQQQGGGGVYGQGSTDTASYDQESRRRQQQSGGGYRQEGGSYYDRESKQQGGATSGSTYQQSSRDYEREEYDRKKAEWERQAAEVERQRQQSQFAHQQNQSRYGVQSTTTASQSQSSYEQQQAEYQRRLAEYERQKQQQQQEQERQRADQERRRIEEERNRQRIELERKRIEEEERRRVQGSTYQNHHNQQNYGSGTYQSGSVSSSGTHQQQGGNVEYDEAEYESYEDENEETSEGKANSGYIDSNAATRTQGSVSSSTTGRRDPSTYGRYDQTAAAGGGIDLGSAALGKNKFTTTTLELDKLAAARQNQGAQGGGGGEGEWRHESHWSQTQDIPPTYFNGVSEPQRDNVPIDRPANKNRFYGRKKRQVLDHHPSIAEIMGQIQCKSVHCIYMRCTVENLEADRELSIAIRARINARVLRNVSSTEPLSFSSVMAARINKLPYIGTPTEQLLHTHEIFSTVSKSESEIKPDVVPLWVVVLSAVAGTIILLLLVLLLYKLGFFKRNRPSNAPERQPLNRNGYNHGDEAL